MNFGNYFQCLLNEKNVSVAELADRLNIRSKNEIYRLFQNKHSYEKTCELTNKILSVVELTQDEKSELYRLMNECKISYSERKANYILSKLYLKVKTAECSQFDQFINFIKKNSQKDITIYIGMLQDDCCVMLNNVLNEYPEIKLIHMVDFNTTEEKIAMQLFDIITFFQNKNHRLFENLGQSDDSILAIAEGNKKCEIAVFDNKTLYTSNISEDMAQYIHSKKLALCGKELKQNSVKIADYKQMLEYACTCDLNTTYAIHGMLCLSEIPFEIIYRLFEDANYFGFPLEHPYIQSMLGVEKKHDELRKTVNIPQYYYLSEKYVKKFLSTGITSGYINEFRPLNFNERIETLKIFEHSEKGIKYRGRFFKEDYDIIDTECCSIDNIGIYITDSQSTPKKTYLQAVITHPKAKRVFKNFSKWFWDNCMYNGKESSDMLNSYINEYTKKENNI